MWKEALDDLVGVSGPCERNRRRQKAWYFEARQSELYGLLGMPAVVKGQHQVFGGQAWVDCSFSPLRMFVNSRELKLENRMLSRNFMLSQEALVFRVTHRARSTGTQLCTMCEQYI